MGKKIDLNSKPTNNTRIKSHYNNYLPQRLPEDAENENELENSNTPQDTAVKNTTKNLAKKALSTKVPSFIANSKVVDDVLDETINATIKMAKKKKTLFLLSIILPLVGILLLILITVFIVLDISGGGSGSSLISSGYYSPRCDEVTVLFYSKIGDEWTNTGTGTYSLDDYVAGVVYAEVRGLKNIEVYKTFAIAARTFLEIHADNTCTIEGSSRKQAFIDVNIHAPEHHEEEAAELIYQAVEETKNEVIMQNNELYGVMYDAFCWIEKDADYYTINQKNQKIAVEWVNSHSGIIPEWKESKCNKNHGQGISQYGAWYLADTQGYDYKDIIEYYLGDDEVTLSSKSFMTSIAGLDVKETKNATNKIQEKLSNFLEQRGSSIEQYEEFIKSNVIETGAGTREGVVTAAVSLINYLYDNFDAKLPYYWGGKYSEIGISNSFGEYIPSKVSRGGNVNYYKSFDCSGFVQWAIINGGFNNPVNGGTASFNDKFSSNSCMERDSDCIGQPGDLINLANGHIMLIVATDVESGKYMVAESTGAGVIMQLRTMHEIGQNYKVLFMDDYYQNNINENYAT